LQEQEGFLFINISAPWKIRPPYN